MMSNNPFKRGQNLSGPRVALLGFMEGFASQLRLNSGEPFELGSYPDDGLSKDRQAVRSDMQRVVKNRNGRRSR
jgi:hypothetical protein